VEVGPPYQKTRATLEYTDPLGSFSSAVAVGGLRTLPTDCLAWQGYLNQMSMRSMAWIATNQNGLHMDCTEKWRGREICDVR
jgi:hypothetical protein